MAGLVRKRGAKAPPLVGGGKADWVIGEEEVTKKTTIAVISRTNFGQFEEMVKLVCQQPKYARPKIALPSPPNTEDPYGWDLLVDLAYYCIGQLENMSLKAQKNKRLKFCSFTLHLLSQFSIWTQIVWARLLSQDHNFIHCFRYRVS